MEHKHKVSVIIPCYNCEDFIDETIQSVLNQSYKNIEIIIIDDGSSDSTLSIANQYKNAAPDIIYVYQNPGKGACAARNYGLQNASGYYIQFLDADDLLSKNKIETQVNALKEQDNSVAVCNTMHFFKHISNATNYDKDFVFSTKIPEQFLTHLWGANNSPHFIAVHSYLTPASIIHKAGTWNETLSKDQDGEFFARVLLLSKGVIYTPDVYSYYRQHINSTNISGQKKRIHLESNYQSTKLKEKYLFEKTKSPEAHNAIALQYKTIAIDAWPQYADITRKALAKCNKLGGSSYLPVLGGRIVELIKHTMGWKVAKAFSYYLHKIL